MLQPFKVSGTQYIHRFIQPSPQSILEHFYHPKRKPHTHESALTPIPWQPLTTVDWPVLDLLGSHTVWPLCLATQLSIVFSGSIRGVVSVLHSLLPDTVPWYRQSIMSPWPKLVAPGDFPLMWNDKMSRPSLCSFPHDLTWLFLPRGAHRFSAGQS